MKKKPKGKGGKKPKPRYLIPLVLLALTGCGLFEAATAPVPTKQEGETNEQLLARIDAMTAQIEALQDVNTGAGTNPWLAATGITGAIGVMLESKRRRLKEERDKLVAELQSRNMSLPEGITLT